MARKIRPGSVWDFDCPDDYYASLDNRKTPDDFDEDDWHNEDPNAECDYWASQCYGRG